MEHAAETDSWKNYQAFQAHYLRLGATDALRDALSICMRVHNTPKGCCKATEPPPTPSSRGGGIAVLGGQIQLRKIAEKSRKIAEKLRKNCDVVSGPPEPSRCYSSGQVAQNSQNFTETNSPWTVQLQEAPLDITVELQHEPKAADVVIQFVLAI